MAPHQICLYCWNHIKGQLNGLCPACRTPYSDDPHKISPVDRDECVAFPFLSFR